MPKRLLLIMTLAFLVAAACSYVVYRLVGNRLVATQTHSTRVVIAATDIKVGSVLKAQDLGWNDSGGTLPKGAILKMEDAIGRGVVQGIYQGEPIVESRLAAPGAGGGLAATIPQGKRAIAVRVDDVVGVAGFVTPGQHVDVLISGTPPNDQQKALGTQVRTLLQDVEVLSAGQDIQRDAEGKPVSVQVVNLLVNPDQAELLTLAGSQTHIQLVLRNPLDNKVVDQPGTAMSNIFTDAPQQLKKPGSRGRALRPAVKIVTVEIYNGNSRSEQKFTTSEKTQ